MKKYILILILVLIIPVVVVADDIIDVDRYVNIDLRPNMQRVYNQMGNSCTAQSVIGSIEYQMKNIKKWDFTPSRSFTYYLTRKSYGDRKSVV